MSENAPPAPDRILRRARVLAALGHRGMLEQEKERARALDARGKMLAWLEREELEDELEDDEETRLGAPLGQLGPQATVDCVWRFEGAVVLAWALSLVELPAHDRVADVGALSRALAIGGPGGGLELRPRSGRELDRGRERAFAIHWRLTEFRLRPGTLDLAAFARSAWFGPLDIDPRILIDGDLGIGGAPIARADAKAVGIATSIARERHQAFNWLNGDDPIYSEVDVST